MKRTAILLAPFLALLLAFYAWHTPLRGPLSEAEVDDFLAKQAEIGGNQWADSEAFEAFLRNDDGRPFVMINLMEFRDAADYPSGYVSESKDGASADAAYGRAVLPLLLRRGSYPISQAVRQHTIINSVGPTAGQFDTLAIVRYRSRRDLIDMITSDAFLAAEVYKWASLENTLVAPASRALSVQAIGYVPLLILVVMAGVIGQAVFSRNRPATPPPDRA
ncbi:MAG: hypothetical protein AAF393_08850 [Pseudomonadota bacterium]